jgi:hypothetical protein
MLLVGVVPVLATAQQRLPAPIFHSVYVEDNQRIRFEWYPVNSLRTYTLDLASDSTFTQIVPWFKDYRFPLQDYCQSTYQGAEFASGNIVRFEPDTVIVTPVMLLIVNDINPGTYYARVAAVSEDTIGQYSRPQRIDVDATRFHVRSERLNSRSAIVRWQRPIGTTRYALYAWKESENPIACAFERNNLISQQYAELRSSHRIARIVKDVPLQQQQQSGEQVDTLHALEPGFWYWVNVFTQPSVVSQALPPTDITHTQIQMAEGIRTISNPITSPPPRRGFSIISPVTTLLDPILQTMERTSIYEVMNLPSAVGQGYYRSGFISSENYRYLIEPLRRQRAESEYTSAIDSLLVAMISRGIAIDTVWFARPWQRCTRGCSGRDFTRSHIFNATIVVKTRGLDKRMEEFGFADRLVVKENSEEREFSVMKEWFFDRQLEFRRYVFKPLRTSVVSSAESDAAVQGGTVVGRVQRVSAGSATIELPTPQSGLVSVEVYSVLGSLMLRQEVYASAPITTLTIPLAGYARGYLWRGSALQRHRAAVFVVGAGIMQ